MASLRPIKRGDTFSRIYSIPIALGAVVSSVTMQLRLTDRTLIQQVTVTRLPDTETRSRWLLFVSDTDTALWPLKTLRADLRRVAVDGTVLHTNTFTITVQEPETIPS